MISKAIVKNTIKESIRTYWAIPVGIIAIGVAVLFAGYVAIRDVVFGGFSFIIFFFSMMFTSGIIASDISDGKILVVLTRPISCAQYFFSKVLGVIIVGSTIVIIMAISMLTILSVKGGYIGIDLKMWFLFPIAGIIVQIMWTLIGAFFSTFIKGSGNVGMIILIILLIGFFSSFIPNEAIKTVTKFMDSYILPQPDACLNLVEESKTFLASRLFHSLFYMVFLSIAGMLVLNHRELGKR